jgi:phage baseplate assembly protein W|tara:strand:- start:319 stop:747 length:429 start_codon:yes stop_codon:yes gene_type:complete
MATYDASVNTNNSVRSNKAYSDLNLNFNKNPATNDVAKLKDVEAVKRAVRNLILTNRFERPFHPEIGSDIRSLLFENMTPVVEVLLKDRIKETIDVYEPRADVTDIIVSGDSDRNEYRVQIEFRVLNVPDPIVVTEFLQRLR